MRIALAQLNPTSGDIEGNTARIIAALEAAAARGADLFLTPEMALPGYCIGDLVEDAGFLAANERAMQRVAAAARGITAVVGFIDFDLRARNESGGSGNTTPRRSSATASSSSARTRRFCPATATSTTSVLLAGANGESRSPCRSGRRHGRLGVSICEDLWDEYYHIKPVAELVAQGAELLININASPFCPGKRHERDAVIRRTHRPVRQAARLREHHRRRGQRQEHHSVRWREPCLRCAGEARRRRPPIHRGTARRRSRPVRVQGGAGWRCRRSSAIAKCTTRS